MFHSPYADNRSSRAGRLSLTLALMSLALALLLGACSSAIATGVAPTAEPTAPPSQRGIGDTLRIVHPQAPETLNPHLSYAVKDMEPARIVYEALATYDPDGNMLPVLAAELPTRENGGIAADGSYVIWKLRQDVMWSDGEPFTADDVAFTYEYLINPDVLSSSGYRYTIIASIDVVDDYTLRINFNEANAPWEQTFVSTGGAILPRHMFEDYNGPNFMEAPANNLPVGTGPYRVMAPGIKPQEVLLLGSELIQTVKITFEPNPYYRDPDKPYFRRIEWRGGGTTENAALSVFQDGSADIAYDVSQLSPATLETMQTNGVGRLEVVFGSNVDRLLLNRTDPNQSTADGERSSLQFAHPFFSDKRVRQAVAYAVNREAVAALYGDLGHPATNNLVIPAQYNSPQNFYPYDPAQAMALLEEAGWKDTNRDGVREKDGQKLKVVYQAQVSEIYQQIQQVIKANLEAVGFEVELKIVDPANMFDYGEAHPDSVYRFNADIMEFEISMGIPDPSDYMISWLSNGIPQKADAWSAGINIERWQSPEYDLLFQIVSVEQDPDKRVELFIKMNDLQIQDVVMVPLVNRADALGVNEEISGIALGPWDLYTWNISEWRRTTP